MTLYIVFIILILISSLLIILAVLVQNPKSGMAANFGASNQVMGVRQTSDYLEKFTWIMAVIILLLSLGATMSIPKSRISSAKGGAEKAIQQSGANNNANNFQMPLETITENDAPQGESGAEAPQE